MTSAPILTSFSLMVVSDQCSTSLGNARVRMKLARLAVTGRGHGAADVGAAVDAAGGYRPAAPPLNGTAWPGRMRSEEHTSELQSLMRISYAVFCLKKKNTQSKHKVIHTNKRR